MEFYGILEETYRIPARDPEIKWLKDPLPQSDSRNCLYCSYDKNCTAP